MGGGGLGRLDGYRLRRFSSFPEETLEEAGRNWEKPEETRRNRKKLEEAGRKREKQQETRR